MTTNPVHFKRAIWAAHGRLSLSDQASIAVALGNEDAGLFADRGSPLAEFLEMLVGFGMAEKEFADDADTFLEPDSWLFTDSGRPALGIILIAGDAAKKAEEDEWSMLGRVALRFFAGYAPVQIAGGLVAYALAKRGIDVSQSGSVGILVLMAIACQVGLWAAFKGPKTFNSLTAIERQEVLIFSASRVRRICVAIAAGASLLHLMVEFAREWFFPGSMAANPVLRALVPAGLAGIWCSIILPSQLADERRRVGERLEG